MKTILQGDFRNRSSQAQEVISRTPGALERWTFSVLTGIVVLFLLAAWFIKYPDTVKAKGVLLAREGVQQVSALRSGRLLRLPVRSGAVVRPGDTLALMELVVAGEADTAVALRSSSYGQLHLVPALKTGHWLEQGGLLGEVVPIDNEFYVRLAVPQRDLGKLYVGMGVKIELDAFSLRDVGYIPGKINYISNVISDSGCAVFVALDGGLLTNLQKKVEGKPGMALQGMVVLRDGRLLERMLPRRIRL